MPNVTIAMVPRERFAVAGEVFQRLFDCTRIPFELVVVNCGIPDPYWQQIEAVIKGRKNVSVIRTDQYLLPNQAKNLVIQESKADYLCLTEMDVLVDEDWLSFLIAACEEHPADVATPLIIDAEGVHGDPHVSQVRRIRDADGQPALEIQGRDTPKEHDRHAGRGPVVFLEDHCLLFRRDVFDRIGLLDEELTARSQLDLSLRLFDANLTCVLEPRARVTYLAPSAIDPEERAYYLFRWDPKRARKSEQRIRERWNIVDMPTAMRFVKRRVRIARDADVRERWAALARR